MHIDPFERLAYWRIREIAALDSVTFWTKAGEKVAPGALKRARDWHKMTVELVHGWQMEVNKKQMAA